MAACKYILCESYQPCRVKGMQLCMTLHYVILFMTLHIFHTQAQFMQMGTPVMPAGAPGGMPMGTLSGMPMGAAQGVPMSMGNMGMPPMPMQMRIMGPQQLPSVVMPYHSRTADKLRKRSKKSKKGKNKKSRHYRSESDSDSSSESDSDCSSSSSSSSESFRRAGHNKRRQVLTPVVSYVTKDGYVVYQKKIKKDRAKDWLEVGKNADPNAIKANSMSEESHEFVKGKSRHRSKSHRKHYHHD